MPGAAVRPERPATCLPRAPDPIRGEFQRERGTKTAHFTFLSFATASCEIHYRVNRVMDPGLDQALRSRELGAGDCGDRPHLRHAEPYRTRAASHVATFTQPRTRAVSWLAPQPPPPHPQSRTLPATLFDYRLLHRGKANRTAAIRRDWGMTGATPPSKPPPSAPPSLRLRAAVAKRRRMGVSVLWCCSWHHSRNLEVKKKSPPTVASAAAAAAARSRRTTVCSQKRRFVHQPTQPSHLHPCAIAHHPATGLSLSSEEKGERPRTGGHATKPVVRTAGLRTP